MEDLIHYALHMLEGMQGSGSSIQTEIEVSELLLVHSSSSGGRRASVHYHWTKLFRQKHLRKAGAV